MAFNHGLSRQSLSRRIVIAFVLMTLLVGGTFSVGIVETVHQVEERLISSELGGDLGRFLQMESLADWRHEPEPGQLFYFSGGLGDFALLDIAVHFQLMLHHLNLTLHLSNHSLMLNFFHLLLVLEVGVGFLQHRHHQ